MKERPILFRPEMVKTILDGRKTQTRRIIRHPEYFGCLTGDCPHEKQIECTTAITVWAATECPYGTEMDKLWVREEHFQFGHWEPKSLLTKSGRMKWRFVPDHDKVLFDAPNDFRRGRHDKDPYTSDWHKRLARFMPKKFSRITLEITGVRVERLQDISEEDAEAEGTKYPAGGPTSCYCMGYSWLWESINGKGSWDKNPWVWVIEFKRIKPSK
jgi:hypothetical protein